LDIKGPFDHADETALNANWQHHAVEFLESEKEYRYHVVLGRVILATVKMRRDAEGDERYRLPQGMVKRNWQHGYWRQVSCPVRPSCETVALEAVRALGLTFGAVDIIISQGRPFVLEVNARPGIDAHLDVYVQAFYDTLATLLPLNDLLR
jgi:glutathione synthase/RimK-type ligase-like ATP-grasp enzyme